MAFHVLRHVETKQLHAQHDRELARHFGLANARRPGEEIAPNRLFRFAQARPRKLDRRSQRSDGLILAKHDPLQVSLEMLEYLKVRLGDCLGRDPSHCGYSSFNLLHADRLAAATFGNQHLRCASLVDDVDRLIRQTAVMDVFGRQLRC